MGPANSQHVSMHQSAMSSLVKPYPPPWRGADCMNGLLKVDITFEGPEHGGIGSTAYAAKVIQESCKETGLPPEATPVVQLTMVLKELLAQRRLNEPFSGGLSSYALLLMVVAIQRERSAIKADMEQQRRAVAGSWATVAKKGKRPPKPPQKSSCSNDILEVLRSGEPTAGKLLMHFLLFYG